MNNNLEQKERIITAAIDIYLNDPEAYSLNNICQKAGVSIGEFYYYFSSKNRVVPAFYPFCVDRYRAIVQEMGDYSEMTLTEKLANFIYTMLDFMDEQRLFVGRTFSLFANNSVTFRREVSDVFRDILESDARVAMVQQAVLLNTITYDLLTAEFFSLVRYWLADESENYAKTMAYVDKLVNFLAEVLEISVVDKGVDLAKFVVQNNLKNVPVINWFVK